MFLESKDKCMALHNELGRTGEQMAAEFLEGSGFTILFRNWRHSRYEIDIIAVKNSVLHFIEVKTRKSTQYGLPEADVDRKKLNSMINASEGFLSKFPRWTRIQYDVLSISITDNNANYFLIEDVYL